MTIYRVTYDGELVCYLRPADAGAGKRLAFADAKRPSQWQEPLQVPSGVAVEGLAIRWLRWHSLPGGAYHGVRKGLPFDVDKVGVSPETDLPR